MCPGLSATSNVKQGCKNFVGLIPKKKGILIIFQELLSQVPVSSYIGYPDDPRSLCPESFYLLSLYI